MRSVEYIKLGETRRVTEILKPATYDLGKGDFVVLHVRCSIERTDVWERQPLSAAQWRVKHYHHETLKVLPTWWQRAKAFVLRRDPPLPRAVAIVDRSAL